MNSATPPGRRRRSIRIGLAAVLLAGTALGGYAVGDRSMAATPPTAQTQTQIQPQPMQNRLPDFSALVKEVRPAVVSITNHLKVSQASDQGQMPQLPFPFNQMIPMHPHAQAIEARGSGYLIDANGTIVTNYHVVKNEKSIEVTLSDGTKLPAKLIGADPRTDIAVLRIHEGHKTPFIKLGNSAKVEPGQWVVAIGNPFGLGGTVTAGIVSARGRDIGAGPYDNFIQIDAPINEGNSGGPLLTQDGEVIGMNTAILSPSGGSVGIGFAIPSNLIKRVVAQLEEHGHVTRGFLGVEAQSLSHGMAAALNLPTSSGALIASVQPDTPAMKAGLKPGDVIQSVNGQTVKDPRDLAVDIANVKPGDQAKLQILRNGKTETVAVNVETMPQNVADNTGNGFGQQHSQAKVGLALAPITPQVRNQLDLPPGTEGAVIAGVTPGSPADNAGLQTGDVVIGVGDQPVTSASQAAHDIRSAARNDHSLALRIIRNGHALFVALDLGHSPNNEG